MHSAMKSFTEIKADRKLIILGDMLELGEKSEDEHIKVIDELHSKKIENVLLVGPLFQRTSSKSGFKSFYDVNKLMEYLKKEPVKGYTILVKASRGIGLERIYNLL